MMSAMTAGAAASGTRSWLGSRRWSWLTPIRLRRVTIALVGAALFAATVVLGGSS
jgi:hypothetical protein